MQELRAAAERDATKLSEDLALALRQREADRQHRLQQQLRIAALRVNFLRT